MIASQLPDSSWFGPLEPERANRPPQQNPALARLWRSFMTGRAVVAVLLLLLQAGIYMLGAGGGRAPLVLWVGYLAATLLVRLFARPRAPGRNFDRQWVYTIGVDVAVFSALQLYQQVSALNYTPLFALPVLLAAVLGSLLLALGTAAGVTLILLGAAWHHALLVPADATSQFLQAGSAPALCGPIFSRPSSIHAIEPPPAPIVAMSIDGSASAWRLTVPAVVIALAPSTTSAASKLVPPMSTLMKLVWRCGRNAASAAVGAAAGPDSSVDAASAATASGEVTPPLGCMMRSTPAKPLSSSRRRRLAR